jgi:hypothetical protein
VILHQVVMVAGKRMLMHTVDQAKSSVLCHVMYCNVLGPAGLRSCITWWCAETCRCLNCDMLCTNVCMCNAYVMSFRFHLWEAGCR